jgi:hypothetical protein
VTEVAPPDTKPDAPAIAAVDIDGVVADARHRLGFLASRPKDWTGFFAAAVADPVLPEGRAVVARLLDEGLELVWLTGRPERCRRDTLAWLVRNGLPDAPLVMRADDDHRPARMTKLTELRRLAKRRRIAVMVDDDVDVVQTLRTAGFAVLHADWMDGGTGPDQAGLLFEAQEAEGRT